MPAGLSEPVTVCIGSVNPVKVRGVRRAFEKFFKYVEVVPVEVVGVAAQPLSFEDVVRGAISRASEALKVCRGRSFGVGVEAGIFSFADRYFDVHAACIYDGSRRFLGFSPAFQVPSRFVELIRSGEFKELEEVVDRQFGTEKIGEKGGLISLLTRGEVVREELVYYAVVMALVPLINRGLYSEAKHEDI